METKAEMPLVPQAAHAELAELRARAAELEAQLRAERAPQTPAADTAREAARAAVAEVWTPPAPAQQPPAHPDAITLRLAPEEHDEKMGELLGILQAHGVSRAIAAAEGSGNAHLIDDFHRVLIEYVKEGLPVRKAASGTLKKALGLALLEVTLPGEAADAREQTPPDPSKIIHDFIALMEQFYRGILPLGEDGFFSFELANAAGMTSTCAYLAVPHDRRELFEKQLIGLYPEAKIAEVPNDYNIFAPQSKIAAAEARLTERPIFGLRSFQEMPNDPLEPLLAVFSKLDRHSEGAAVQFVISPGDRGLGDAFREAVRRINEGVPIHKAAKAYTGLRGLAYEMYLALKNEYRKRDRPAGDDPRMKAIERKIQSPVLYANVRIIASAATKARAENILATLEGPFAQLSDASGGNRLAFRKVPERRLGSFEHLFSYRLYEKGSAIALTASELSSLAHLPRPESAQAAPEVRQEKTAEAPAPSDMPQEGTLLGLNRFRGTETPVHLLPEDRLRHLYIIGQTGTGKSKLLDNVIIQDIRAGNGVCFIDPHGSDVLEVLSAIPPERQDDVIYFDPGSLDRPLALNMLEFDPALPEQKTLVVDELFGIFKKLFGAVPESMGPAFEQYFRNAALLVMDDPESGNTLLDISRIFASDEFRAMKLSRCKNPIIRQFWEDIASKTTGEQGLANYGPYITNKFDVFTTNEIMRPIIAQQKSSFNFRDIMDNRKILLVNLAKGKIGEINANLLGLIIVGKFLLAALSRTDALGTDLPPFYLHIDEFQNFTTPSIATILSEARKYKLSLTVAHQFIAQLEDEIKDAVFGNVGSLVSFRVGADDAEYLEKQFAPVFSQSDLMRVDNYRAFARLLMRGRPVKPFSFETLPFEVGSAQTASSLRELSALRYGRPRSEIEAEIAGQ